MCNLYSMTRAKEAMLRLFRVGHNRAGPTEPANAIFPARTASVVRIAADGARELVPLSWGFVLPQTGRAPRRVTNFRDDKTASSPFWRESFESRRCLVPATAFAEPREITPAPWAWFALSPDARDPEDPISDGARPLFAFAGIWRRWRGPVKKDGPSVELDVFSFMTTLPNAVVAAVNHERMPVILADAEARDTWLHGTPREAFALARSLPAEQLRLVQESFEKADRETP